MKDRKRDIYYVVEIMLAVLALTIEFMCVRYASADKNNNKALSEWNGSDGGSYYINKAIELNGKDPAFYLNRGVMRFRSGEVVVTVDSLLAGHTVAVPDKVLWDLEKSVSLANGEPLPVLNLAMAYALKKDYEKALRVLKPLTEQKKCWPAISVFCGLVFELSNKDDEAVQLYIKAIKESPFVLESPFFDELKLRNPDMAQYAFVQVEKEIKDAFSLTKDPIDGAVLGEIAFIKGDIERADSLLRWSLSVLPSMDRAWLFLGRIYENKQNLELAEDCYEKATKLDEHDPLPNYFLKKVQGKSSNLAEQMKDMISIQQKLDFRRRYKSIVLLETILDGFDSYCAYDYVSRIKAEQKQSNLKVVKNITSSFVNNDIVFSDLVSEIANFLVGTPCEVGLLDVYPEQLRVFLYKTDRLQYIEECLAISLVLKQFGINFNEAVDEESFYECLCNKIKDLRYRDGVINCFTDRIYYISEWLEQAEKMGSLVELTPKYGHEYVQNFTYLSDNLIYLPQVGKEPKAWESVKAIEKTLMAKNPYYLIDSEKIDLEFMDSLINGDIIAICSDRKGEDISNIGFVHTDQDGKKQFIFASTKEKVVTKKDLSSVVSGAKGIRLFRLID